MENKLYDIKILKAGSIIYLEGSKSLPYIFVIKEGKVKKHNSVIKEVTAETLNPGETFGLVSCLTGHTNMEQMTALTDCELISIPKENIIPFFSRNNQAFLKLVKTYSNKVRQYDEIYKQLSGVEIRHERAHILLDAAAYFKSQKETAHQRYALAKYVENSGNSVMKKEILEKYSIIPDDCVLYTKFDKELHFKKGDIIFLEYELADLFFLIKKGKVKTSHYYQDEEVILSILKEGDFFGEMALLNDTRRMASATAYEDCTLMCLTMETFFESLSDIILERIFFKCAERIYTAYKLIVNQSLHDPVSRIYDYIEFLIKTNQGIVRQDSFTLNFSYEDLKRMIDLSDAIESDFEKFESDANIRLKEGQIIIKSISRFIEKQ